MNHKEKLIEIGLWEDFVIAFNEAFINNRKMVYTHYLLDRSEV